MNAFLHTVARRVAVMTASALVLVLASAAPANAHIEVDAPGAQAGAGPATLVFAAEAESDSAGIVGVKTQLPAGISPQDVSLSGGPAGWALLPTADGFEITGPAIGPGVDAEYSVVIDRLPADRTELAFPTLQRYSDGREDAWIEPVTAAVPDPQLPAPVLSVAPAAAGTTAAPSPSASDTTATKPGATYPAPVPAAQSAEEDSNVGTTVLVIAVLAVLASVGAAYWAARRRRAR